jgi:hypothetical protein
LLLINISVLIELVMGAASVVDVLCTRMPIHIPSMCQGINFSALTHYSTASHADQTRQRTSTATEHLKTVPSNLYGKISGSDSDEYEDGYLLRSCAA